MVRALLEVTALSVLLGACGGGAMGDADAQRECAEAVKRYSDLYVSKWGDHNDPAFDEVLAVATKHVDEVDGPRDDCQTLVGIADVIRDGRAGGHTGSGGYAPRRDTSMSAGNIFGLIIACLAYLVSAVGGIWLLVVAFKESAMWGVISLVVPLGAFVFVVMHWHVAKTPFLLNIGGAVLAVMGLFMAGPEFVGAVAGG